MNNFSNTFKFFNRKNTSSLKFDAMSKMFGDNSLEPFWVADMDFCSPDFIFDIFHNTSSRPLGYPFIDDSFFEAILFWFSSRFGCELNKSWILPSNGVVASIFSCILAFSEKDDGIVVFSPVYSPFFSTPQSLGRELICVDLLVGDNGYEIDFERFEEICIIKKPKILLFCSPHNPSGRVWSFDELAKTALICARYGVKLVSDEIHFDLTYSSFRHFPLILVEPIIDNLILLSSPTKTFNIPALNISYAVVPNPKNREKLLEVMRASHQNLPNIFGIEALKACYNQGASWLDDLILYLSENRALIEKKIALNPLLGGYAPQGSYLYWVDFSKTKLSQQEIFFRLKKAKVALSPGDQFFNGRESSFFRFNFATSMDRVEWAMDKIGNAFDF